MNIKTIQGAGQLVNQGLALSNRSAVVNGQAITGVTWSAPSANRVQMYLEEDAWTRANYDVTFGPAALSAPYNLAYGSKVTFTPSGQTIAWQGVVRRIEPQDAGGVLLCVVALVEEIPV